MQEFVTKNATTFTAPALDERMGGKMASLKDEERSEDARDASVDMKLEIVVIPVSDVDRAKEFYGYSS